MPAAENAEHDIAETLTFEGSEPLKSLEVKAGKARVGAYAIRFSGPEEKDLTGDYFTAQTDFGPRKGDGAPAMFNHGQPYSDVFKTVCSQTFGPIKTRADDVGIFAEATLDLSDQYQAAIYKLCQGNKLKWSTGTAAHLMQKSADGQITRWHIIESSFTPTPAEPRLPAIRPLKSLSTLNTPPLTEQLATAFEQLMQTPAPIDPIAPIPEFPVVDIPPAPMSAVVAPTLSAEEEAANQARLRESEVAQMKSLGTHFKCVELADDFVHLGKSLAELRQEVAEKIVKAKPVVANPTLGMAKSDLQRWSLVKAIREVAFGGGTHALTGVEKEASTETAKRIGKSATGFFIPMDALAGTLEQTHEMGANTLKSLLFEMAQVKSLNATTFTAGGALTGTELLTGSMIELLRNKPLVAQMGARTLTGLVGNVAIPQLTGGATTFWLGENQQITESDQTFGQLGLTPKKVGACTEYSKELLNQSSLSVEALVRDDLMTVLGIAKDLSALYGSGGAQPLGIKNTTGIESVTFGGSGTRALAISFQSKVAAANASRGALAYLTSPLVAGAWMSIPEVPNYPTWLWQGTVDTGMVVGRRAESTNQVSDNIVFYGNWQDLILADWAGIDVTVNPYSKDMQGIVRITIYIWTDSGCRHAVSFCVSTDAGNQ